MKIGLDIHGVIDRYHALFSDLSYLWVREGHEVFVITGQEFSTLNHKLEGIAYTGFFSIVEHHKEIGTKIWNDDPRGSGWWMDGETWNHTKGDFATRVGLDIHFDDESKYAPYFPKTCTFIRVCENFDETWSKLHRIGI